MHYPQAVILPPKIYHYEPKIFGFKVAGKRGSHYFQPSKGNVRYIEDSVQSLEMQEVKEAAKEKGVPIAIDFNKKLNLQSAGSDLAAKGAAGSEDNEA